MSNFQRRTFIQATAAGSLAAAISPAVAAEESSFPAETIGPLVGHVEPTKALVWFRAVEPGPLELNVTDSSGGMKTLKGSADAKHDLCVHWTLTDLLPAREYRATVVANSKTKSQPCVIYTPAEPEKPARVQFVLGSCASSTKFFDVWDQMATAGADGVVLLGDTPYIDKTDLETNRKKQREFLSIPNLAEFVRTRPLWATWDDHDFGANDSDGTIKNKHLIRQAFCEYRALDSYGDGKHGIYTKFRYGPVEVFLLDPRYFSQTEPSPVDATQKTCLGKTQWQWLLDGLAKSTAPFKILASGMIWDDKQNKEKDDWHTYAHEREGLFDFIGEKKISGVMLIGGDIHVSRHLKYPLKDRIGYDLHQLIVSPLHERVLPVLNVPHPNLIWGEPLPHIFLQLTCDSTVSPATLHARWINITGKVVYEIKTTSQEMTAASK